MYGMRVLTRGIPRVLSQRPLLAARRELTNTQLRICRYEHSKDNMINKAKDKASEFKKEMNKNDKDQSKKEKKNEEGDSSDNGYSHMEYSPIAMKIVPAVCGSALNYVDRNVKLGRHLSPCLSIYKMQLTSVMSISLRMTGLFLAVCVWAVGILGFFGKRDLGEWADKLAECDFKRSLVNVAKFMFVFPFSYHFVAGARHLLWQLNIFLTKPEIYATGYVALALSVLLTAAMLGLQWGEDAKKVEVDMTEPKQTANQGMTQEELDDSEDLETIDEAAKRPENGQLDDGLKDIDLKTSSKDLSNTQKDSQNDS